MQITYQIKQNIQTAALCALFLCALGVVGQWDYEDAVAQATYYCDKKGGVMVETNGDLECHSKNVIASIGGK